MASRTLSFSLYVDYLLARGVGRLAAAAEQNRVPFDTYKAFKGVVAGIVRRTSSPDQLVALMDQLPTQRTRDLYRGLVTGFLAFMAGPCANAVPFVPPHMAWDVAPELALNVNPEMGLVIVGVPHVIKLYCRVEPMEKARVEMMGAVMSAALQLAPGTMIAVLDVRKARLHVVDPMKLGRAVTVVKAERASFAALVRASAAA